MGEREDAFRKVNVRAVILCTILTLLSIPAKLGVMYGPRAWQADMYTVKKFFTLLS